MAETIKVTELGFDAIKQNLKDFLSTQTEFLDYDFEASGLDTLLSVLAYNTHYKAIYANFLANEQFLDTAAKRSSILSHAKSLGYTPRGFRGARARIEFTITNLSLDSGYVAPPVFVIPRGTVFGAVVGNTPYTYVTTTEYSAPLVSGEYYFPNIELVEGVYFVQEELITDVSHQKRYLIANSKCDTSTLKMMMRKNSVEDVVEIWEPSTTILSLNDQSKVFFFQEVNDQKYEIYFGDGYVGKQPVVNNIMHIEYVSTHGVGGNGAAVFTPLNTILHEGNPHTRVDTYTIGTVQKATSGSDAETLEEIRINASSQFIAQQRAITTEDYKTLIRNYFANIRNIRVWGGEDNDPPQYSRVYVCIQPQYGDKITELDKRMIRDYMRTKSIANIQLEFADHDFLDVSVDIAAYYDPAKLKIGEDLHSQIINTISTYDNLFLNTFDSVFRYSKFINAIDKTSRSIRSNITNITLYKTFFPELGKTRTYSISFLNALRSANNSLRSTPFNVWGTNERVRLTNIGSDIYTVVDLSDNTSYNVEKVGTVDFEKGVVELSGIKITAWVGSGISIYCRPASNDIESSENIILRIPTTRTNVTIIADVPGVKRTRITPSV